MNEPLVLKRFHDDEVGVAVVVGKEEGCFCRNQSNQRLVIRVVIV